MSVSRRLVLYVPGYDPRRPTHYHALYQTEAAKQEAVSGHRIGVSDITRCSSHVVQWAIDAEIEGARIETRYQLLWWDDIVRASWVRGSWALFKTTVASSWRALRLGVLRRVYQWSWPAAVSCSLPFFLLCALLLFCLGLPPLLWAIGSLAGDAAGWAGLGIGVALGLVCLWLGFRIERKFNLAWVGHIIHFISNDARDRVPRLEERRTRFAAHLRAALEAGEDDEILVVGHSVGSTLALSIVARCLEAARGSRSRLSLLTLGQTNCWLAFFPEADRFRAEIAAAATSEDFDWIDFSAPPDAACFALTDPYTALGDRRTDRRNPKLLNAKFHEIMDPAVFAKTARDWRGLHFQYIEATAVRADYDYFAITAGPNALAERYANRPSVRNFTRLRSKAMKHVR